MSVCSLRSTGSSSQSRRRPPHSNASRNSLATRPRSGTPLTREGGDGLLQSVPIPGLADRELGGVPTASDGRRREGPEEVRRGPVGRRTISNARGGEGADPPENRRRIRRPEPRESNGDGVHTDLRKGRRFRTRRRSRSGGIATPRRRTGRPSVARMRTSRTRTTRAKTVLEAEARLLFALLPSLIDPNLVILGPRRETSGNVRTRIKAGGQLYQDSTLCGSRRTRGNAVGSFSTSRGRPGSSNSV